MDYKIPVYRPSLNGNEKKYVNECLDSTWISSKGEFIGKFENGIANYIGVKHAASVSNGTVAIHLTLLALGIGPGDEVIVPTLTYIASVNAIVYAGATPVFVDSLHDTWQMNPQEVMKKITSRTKAVIAVHLYGHPCEMDTITKICRENNIFLIEDCAEAIGSQYKNQHVGTFGDISTFSFFGNKTITTGEGGMVMTNDETLHDRVLHFKGQGLAKHREYWHDIIGYNYRMTNVCAAIGLAQLEQINSFLENKRRVADFYKNAFKGSAIEFHGEATDIYHSYWMCSILVDEPAKREPLREHLASNEIETRPLFYPIHTMPMYSGKYQKYPVAEDLGWRGICLPSYPSLSMEDLEYITDKILSFECKL
ncbi:MAG: DegT/DnrJ/EryC1/StrS family aminotransferase [Ginsengibacter sp.]